MAPLWEDPRVARGMEALLARRAERLAAGEAPVGWKVGFGTPAAMGKLGTSAPLVGFLTSGTRVEPGATVATGSWGKAVLEPEISVRLAADLPGDAEEAAVRDAIGALGCAIELVDLDGPVDQPEALLAGNLVHRAVLLGPEDPARAGGRTEGLTVEVWRDGERIAAGEDPLAAIGGDLVGLVRHVAAVLGAFGERLRAGEVIITGSTIVPPPSAEPEARVRYALGGVGEVEVGLAAA